MYENVKIINLLEAYCRRKNISPGSVGKYAIGEYAPIERLNKGRMTYERAARLLQYLSDNWPDDLEWPADIDRPPATPNPAPKTAFHCEGSGGAVMKGGT